MSLHKDSNSVSAVFIPNNLVHRGIQILIKLAGNGSVGRGVYHQGQWLSSHSETCTV